MSFVLSWNSNFRECSPGRLLLLMFFGKLKLEFQLLLLLCYLECIYIHRCILWKAARPWWKLYNGRGSNAALLGFSMGHATAQGCLRPRMARPGCVSIWRFEKNSLLGTAWYSLLNRRMYSHHYITPWMYCTAIIAQYGPPCQEKTVARTCRGARRNLDTRVVYIWSIWYI